MVHRSEILHAPHFGRYYRRVGPAPALSPAVEAYWQLDSYAPIPQGVAEHLLPRLNARLVLPFANRCLYQLQDGSLRQPEGPHLLLPQAGTVACLHPASQGILGVSFRPGGQALVMNLDTGPDGPILPLPQLADLQAELAELDFAARACRLDAWLFACQASHGLPEMPLLNQALSRLALGESVAGAAEALGWSPRSLQRHCNQLLGLSPRTCQRVLRLRSTLARLWSEPSYSVWDSPYYDYAHFFREFRSLTGTTPTAYLQRFS